MIALVRTLFGALLGATLAGVALRAKRLADEQDRPLVDTLSELPDALKQDVGRIRAAAAGAVRDGRRAARDAEVEIDKVLREGRRKRGEA